MSSMPHKMLVNEIQCPNLKNCEVNGKMVLFKMYRYRQTGRTPTGKEWKRKQKAEAEAEVERERGSGG